MWAEAIAGLLTCVCIPGSIHFIHLNVPDVQLLEYANPPAPAIAITGVSTIHVAASEEEEVSLVSD